MNVEKIYLIDPYESYDNYVKATSYKNLNFKKIQDEAMNRLKNYQDKISWIKKYSSDAVKELPENLDFIYIDGNHTYQYVKEDLRNYYPKLKIGGIFAGHDITSIKTGVAKAFCEFVSEYNLNPFISKTDWWIIKK